MNKFKRYKCDTCNKEIDVENDIKRAFIDKCTLTSGCKGRLRFLFEKNTKENILNYKQNPQDDNINVDVFTGVSIGEHISASNGTSNLLVIGVKGVNSDELSATLAFNEIVNKQQEYKEYQFNVNVPASIISGKDNSIDKKILTFSESDTISIFVNGELVPPSMYVSSNNIIKFNDIITYTTFNSSSLFVRVLVYAKLPETQKTLLFRRNAQYLTSGAWANVSEFSIGNDIYKVYVCDDLSGLTLNSRLVSLYAKIGDQLIPNDRVVFLLSKAPFSHIDRVLTQIVKFENLVDTINHLRYSVENSANKILVTSQTLRDVFPIIVPSKIFSKDVEFSFDYVSTSSDVELNNFIDKKNSFILGPV